MNDLMWAITCKDVSGFASAIYSPLITYTTPVIERVFKFAVKYDCFEELAYLVENIEISFDLRKQLLNTVVTKDKIEYLKLLANSDYMQTHPISQYLEIAILNLSVNCIKWIVDNTTEENFIWSCITACKHGQFQILKLLMKKFDTNMCFTSNPLQEKLADAVGKSGNIEIYELTKHMFQHNLSTCIDSALVEKFEGMDLVLHILTTYMPPETVLFRHLKFIFSNYQDVDILKFVKIIWPKYDTNIFQLAIDTNNLIILDFVLGHSDFKIINRELCDQLEKKCTTSFACVRLIERLLDDSRISLVEFAKQYVQNADYNIEGMCEVADILMSDPKIFWECATPLQKRQWHAAQRKKYSKLHAELIMRSKQEHIC